MRDRESKQEPAAAAGHTFRPDPTFMQFDKIFGDGQAESRSSILHRHGFSAVEPFKDPRKFLRRDSATRIAYATLNESLPSRSRLRQNSTPFRRELDAHLHQVVPH